MNQPLPVPLSIIEALNSAYDKISAEFREELIGKMCHNKILFNTNYVYTTETINKTKKRKPPKARTGIRGVIYIGENLNINSPFSCDISIFYDDETGKGNVAFWGSYLKRSRFEELLKDISQKILETRGKII